MKVNQTDIAKRLGLARSTVTKILNQFPNNRASEETVQLVFQTAREMGYDFSRLRNIHRRRGERRQVEIGVSLTIFLKGESMLFDSGAAKVSNLSPFGALLTDISTGRNVLPLNPFTMKIDFSGELEGLSVKANIIRLNASKSVQMGIDFFELDADSENRILKFLA